MSDNSDNKNVVVNTGGCGSVSIGFVVFVVFLILKLTGQVAWSWIWVTCPLWLPIGLVFGFWALMMLLGLIVIAIGSVFEK